MNRIFMRKIFLIIVLLSITTVFISCEKGDDVKHNNVEAQDLSNNKTN